MRRYTNQIIQRQEHDRKLKLLDDAERDGHLATAQGA